MSAAIVDQEPPPVIIGERLVGGCWNVEGRVHGMSYDNDCGTYFIGPNKP